ARAAPPKRTLWSPAARQVRLRMYGPKFPRHARIGSLARKYRQSGTGQVRWTWPFPMKLQAPADSAAGPLLLLREMRGEAIPTCWPELRKDQAPPGTQAGFGRRQVGTRAGRARLRSR